MNFMNKFNKFMIGRYGIDELYYFLFGLYVLLLIINLFFNSKLITCLELFLLIIILSRSLSKKLAQRRNENIAYLNLKKKILKPFLNLKRNIKDKNHVYKKCHHCHTTLKLPLPSKKGIKTAKCPHCQSKVKIFTLKHQKIEIISN